MLSDSNKINNTDHMKWSKVDSISNASLEELQKIVLVLGSKLNLRIVSRDKETSMLELSCESGQQAYRAEALIHQAYSDLKLRKKIQSKSQFDISSVIEAILNRT